jgi:hypothetical protein
MNMLEVTCEMSKHANYIVGSEELEPDDGWPYTLDLESLNTPNLRSFPFSKDLVENYGQFYNRPPHNTYDNWPVTQSALDLAQIPRLAKSVSKFASRLNSSLNSDYDAALVENFCHSKMYSTTLSMTPYETMTITLTLAI